MLKKIIDTLIETSKPTSTFPRHKTPTVEEIKQVITILDHVTLKAGSALKHSLKDKVKPRVGSVVFCRLGLNQVEHTGIYVGYNKIIHLEGDGHVRTVSPEVFLARLGGFNKITAHSIYVACKNGKPIHSSKAAMKAKIYGAHKTNYALFSNNCHKFSSGCVTGNRDNKDSFFSLLESTLKQNHYGLTEWKIWDL
ncbi:lecithin retinol acyltransferase family protein [Acinetobacter wuhouensis]|uniref:lecithin retinol acyltransferase family protein n=1 Tax=Acinetobacter wuhouensis TaxID=1879050 RepID=UPI001D1830BD|nr:lecithin retinol acyltransferase family protein [Acinetobacter wuhouensis]